MNIVSYSYCNETHLQTTVKTKEVVAEKLPDLFQGHLLCAGVNVGQQGSCKGDSGGPLMYYDFTRKGYVQIATVHGAVRDCGDEEYPGIYVRLDYPTIYNFISSVVNN